MITASPLITVALPARNAQATLRLAIRSILLQSVEDFELLVCDDGSSDDTAAIARSFHDSRVRVLVDGASRGLIARLNQMVRLARGNFFARMDADDVAFPTRFAAQLEVLRRDPTIDLVGGTMLVIDERERLLGQRKAPPDHSSICANPARGIRIAHPTYFGRTEWFRQNEYRNGAERCEDQELLLRARHRSRYANVEDPLLAYREGSLALRKLLLGRKNWALHAGRTLLSEGRPLDAARSVGGQVARSVLELIAVTTGAERILLRHRARPVREVEFNLWEQVRLQVARPLPCEQVEVEPRRATGPQ